MAKNFLFGVKGIVVEAHNFPKQDERKNGWIYHARYMLKRAIKLFTSHYNIQEDTYIRVSLDRRIKTYYAACVPIYIDFADYQAYEIFIARDLENNAPEFILWHELAHLIQYQTKRIQSQTDLKTKYNGKWYYNLNHLDDNYNDLPWELNARMVSHKLWKRYKPQRMTKKNRKYYFETTEED